MNSRKIERVAKAICEAAGKEHRPNDKCPICEDKGCTLWPTFLNEAAAASMMKAFLIIHQWTTCSSNGSTLSKSKPPSPPMTPDVPKDRMMSDIAEFFFRHWHGYAIGAGMALALWAALCLVDYDATKGEAMIVGALVAIAVMCFIVYLMISIGPP